MTQHGPAFLAVGDSYTIGEQVDSAERWPVQLTRVIVLSIPDWGVMPFAEGRDRAKIGREIDQFNAIAREESEGAGAAWVDITPTSRAMKDGWAAPDGLHPSGAQYSAWAALAFGPAKKALAVT